MAEPTEAPDALTVVMGPVDARLRDVTEQERRRWAAIDPDLDAPFESLVDLVLIDVSVTGMVISVARNAIGIPSVTQNASFGSRNNPRISSTSASPRNAFLINSRMRSL